MIMIKLIGTSAVKTQHATLVRKKQRKCDGSEKRKEYSTRGKN